MDIMALMASVNSMNEYFICTNYSVVTALQLLENWCRDKYFLQILVTINCESVNNKATKFCISLKKVT